MTNQKSEIERLRVERDTLRGERDALHKELSGLKKHIEESGSAELRLLAIQLSREIKEKFYGNLKTVLWILAILVGVATAGGYFTLEARVTDVIENFQERTDEAIEGIDKKVSDRVVREVEAREEDIAGLTDSVIASVVEFRTKAALELQAVRNEKEETISEFAESAEEVLAAIEAERRRVESEGRETREYLIGIRVTQAEFAQVNTISNEIFRTIPVVVHVVYTGNQGNISDQQISSQIRALNEDFQARNADLISVPEPFKPLIGNARLAFELARVDPNGRPTTGIVRVESDRASFDIEAVKAAKTGGSDPWDRDRYLNIWVADLNGGLLSAAQFPGGPAETDGIVTAHQAFGTEGTVQEPFHLGRATTQSVAQWLGLRHIWGDDGDGCSGSDFVDDTPNQAGPNFGVPAFPSVTCDNGPAGDMFMNFLDYTDDNVAVMFTKGQVSRMHETLIRDRGELGL